MRRAPPTGRRGGSRYDASAMALIVQKYGGSSLADAEKIKNVARRGAEQAPGHQLVVVCRPWARPPTVISLAR